jgi:signal transduction histidine kinase/CheY-like chemotaxis protein
MYWLRRFGADWAAAVLRSEGGLHGLLLSCTFGAGLISLIFYFLAPVGYAREANLWATIAFWTVTLLVPFRHLYVWLCNLTMLISMLLMTYIASCTGGINSPALVWMTIAVVPLLLLLGRQWAQAWVVVCLLIFVVQWFGVNHGWISGDFVHSPRMIIWAFLDKTLMIISLLITVNFYERIHQHQMQAVEQSNQALEDAQADLIQTQSHKDEFVAAVGHELRTPMNAILGLNEVLQTELADCPEQMQMAQHIRESTEQLLRLVNDILDFSQLEAGRLSLQEKPVQLRLFLKDFLAPYQSRASQKSLSLNWYVVPDVPTWLWLDPMRLKQLLGNLIENALKFTHQGGVGLQVKLTSGMVRFEVQDSGRGIALDRQPHIFNRFEHADVQTLRSYGGAGLGLAVCEKLTQLHGGRIGVQSTLGQGALFWFELPLKAAEAEDTVLPVATANGRLTLLLVDDNTVNLMVAKLVLQKIWPSAVVQTAGGGAEALSLLEKQRFDVVLMDMIMPGMDGIETTRQVRSHAQSHVAHIPVIGLTASNNSHDTLNCLLAGMNEVLIKPLDDRRLKEVVAGILGQRDTEAELC